MGEDPYGDDDYDSPSYYHFSVFNEQHQQMKTVNDDNAEEVGGCG